MNMNHSKTDREDFFKTHGIKPPQVKYYIGWLDKFFQFYSGGLNEVSNGDLIAFGDFFFKNGMEEWQIIQARESVFLYIKSF